MEIKVIPAKPEVIQEGQESSLLRVAAYCRVSTLLEEQETSYEAQIYYYTTYINGHKGWVLEGIYADEGISGTGVKKRDEFNRMIAHCMEGKIDLIITKSVSRFARNTLDCIQYIRLLKERSIPVLFEKEGVNTLDAKGEILITILASLAQQESLSISQNIRMGIRYQYQQGRMRLNYSRFMGYTKDEEGRFCIVPEEADVVRRIYREFLGGKSPWCIARDLNEDKIRTCTGKGHWYDKTIRSILRNEKYIGDALLQKEYVADYLTKRRSKNAGLLPQYYVENHHPPIISREEFQQAQEEFLRRRRKPPDMPGTSGYAFSGKMVCSCCGQKYYRIKAKQKSEENRWHCKTQLRNIGPCDSRIVTEREAQIAVMDALKELAGTDPTVPQIKQFKEATIAGILERIVVTRDGMQIKFIGMDVIDVICHDR